MFLYHIYIIKFLYVIIMLTLDCRKGSLVLVKLYFKKNVNVQYERIYCMQHSTFITEDINLEDILCAAFIT